MECDRYATEGDEVHQILSPVQLWGVRDERSERELKVCGRSNKLATSKGEEEETQVLRRKERRAYCL